MEDTRGSVTPRVVTSSVCPRDGRTSTSDLLLGPLDPSFVRSSWISVPVRSEGAVVVTAIVPSYYGSIGPVSLPLSGHVLFLVGRELPGLRSGPVWGSRHQDRGRKRTPFGDGTDRGPRFLPFSPRVHLYSPSRLRVFWCRSLSAQT